MTIEPWLRDCKRGVELRLHCQPRASKTEIVGRHGEAIKIRLAAPPADREANEELCQFLTRYFGCPATGRSDSIGQGCKAEACLHLWQDG